MENKDFYKGVNLAITVSDKEGNVLYQNDSSIEVNGDVRGRNMMGCHNERSQQIIRHLVNDAATNAYEDEAKQAVGGLIEFSIVLPEEMPHYDRG